MNNFLPYLASGRMSLMIGAGFSKNAYNPENIEIPDWTDLKEKLKKHLYHDSNNASEDVLILAQEYMDSPDHGELDDFIKKNVPDEKLFPNSIYHRMLRQPWNQIFTTNYDTLLERAAKKITTRKYSVVTNEKLLSKLKHPRIVKLHGSFPNQTPYIMSEDQYRRYKDNYPLFTNTIRQSLIENALCLIGFSGVDPNFQKWIGWIRDKLGNENPIFLIECRDIPTPQLNSMEKKNMQVINLAEKEEFKNDYKEALDQFLSLCEDHIDLNKDFIKWPVCDDFSLMSPTDDNIDSVLNNWKQDRAQYPQWFILPNINRQRLWSYTERHMNKFDKDLFQYPKDIEYAYELTWRIEKCVMPLYQIRLGESLLEIVKRYNPFIGENSYKNAIYSPQNKEYNKVDWEDIKEKWVQIIFALSAKARLENNIKLGKFLLDKLLSKSIVSKKSTWEAKWYYEKSLWALLNFDTHKLNNIMSKWPDHDDVPYEPLWKAGLIYELGNPDDANKLLENALVKVRAKVISESNPPCYLHHDIENYILGFLHILKQSSSHKNNQHEFFSKWQKDVNKRWGQLKLYGCDYWDELLFFQNNLKSIPSEFNTTKKTQDFLTGTILNSMNMKCVFQNDHIAGLSLSVFSEQTGLPCKVGIITMFDAQIINNVANWLYPDYPDYIIMLIARYGNGKEFIEHTFSRKKMACCSRHEVDKFSQHLVDLLMNFVDIAAYNDSTNGSGIAFNMCKVIPLILGRLAFLCSEETLIKILPVAEKFYYHSSQKRFFFRDETDSLFSGMLTNRSWNELLEIFPTILNLPIPSDQEILVAKDPILCITKPCRLKNKSSLKNKIKPTIEKLLDDLKKSPSQALSLRLIHLNMLEILTNKQKQNLSNILWSHLDDDGFPKYVKNRSWSLSLPFGKDANRKNKIKKWLLSLTPPYKHTNFSGNADFSKNSVSLTGGNVVFFREINFACKENLTTGEKKYLKLSSGEATIIYDKLFKWWKEDKNIDSPKKKETNPLGNPKRDEMLDRFSHIPEMFAYIIIPSWNKKTALSRKTELLKWLEDLYKIDIPCSEAYVSFLRYDTKIEALAKNAIMNELSIQKRNMIQHAHSSVVNWLYMKKNGITSCQCPQELIEIWETSLMLQVENHYDYWLTHILRKNLYDNINIDKILYFLKSSLPAKDIDEDNASLWYVTNMEVASNIAFNLYNYCKSTKNKISPILNDWKRLSQKSAFPGIRNIWK